MDADRRRALNREAQRRRRAKDGFSYDRDYMRGRRARGEYKDAAPKEIAAARVKKWAAANPGVRAAHYALQNAVRRGEVVREPCFVCGADAQAHHSSYAEDMRTCVTWLCAVHHGEAHRLAADLQVQS